MFRWVVLAVLLTWAGAGIYIGLPLTIGALAGLPAFPVFLDLQRQSVTPAANLEIAIQSLSRAGEWSKQGAVYTDLGFLELLLAESTVLTEAERKRWLDRAAANFVVGLELSPIQPQAWLRLALVRDIQERPAADVIDTLMMSFAVAPAVRSLAPSRMNLMLEYWWSLTPEQRVLAARQITMAWQVDRRDVLRAAANPQKAPIIEYALATLPGAAAEFRRYLLRRAL